MGGAIKRKSRATTTRRKEPPRITPLDPMARGMLKKETKEKERPMGQGMMAGSNTPWAQGPANFLYGCPPVAILAQVSIMPLSFCRVCFEYSHARRCACRAELYCSRACQRQYWSIHKQYCQIHRVWCMLSRITGERLPQEIYYLIRIFWGYSDGICKKLEEVD